jgi:predicted ATPase/DNA-binding NarL/FixJ family response regulator
LIGPAGVGKTRLALEVADRVADDFVDGVHTVSLGSVVDPADVLPAVADALKVSPAPGRSLRERVSQAVAGKRQLILLDNFEQVLPAAQDVAALLGLPGPQLLVTSRAPLHLSGEREYWVEPLAYPAPGARQSWQTLVRFPSVALFIDRARALGDEFEPSPAQADTIAQICGRLDGIPLAIELAAARLRIFSLADLVARLDRPLSLLTEGPRDFPVRQQAMRNTIEWSYQLLTPAEQLLFARLSIFPADFSTEAAEHVQLECDPDEGHLVERMTRLVEHNLVRRTSSAGGAIRLAMFNTIRDFGRERLEAAGEFARVADEHASYFLRLAEEAEPHLRNRPVGPWLDRLEMERENFGAALRRYLESGQTDLALRLVVAIWRFLYLRGHLDEGRRRLEEVLAAADPTPSRLRADALHAACELARALGQYDAATRLGSEALDLYRRLGLDDGVAGVLVTLGLTKHAPGDYVGAARLLEESVALYEKLGDEIAMARSQLLLGGILWSGGQEGSAHELAEKGLHLFRRLGEPTGIANALLLRGRVELARGHLGLADSDFIEARDLFKSVGNPSQTATTLYCVGLLELRRGNAGEAHRLQLENLAIRIELRESYFVASTLQALAAVAAAQRRFVDAVLLLSAGSHIYENLGGRRPAPLDAMYQPLVESLQKAVDPATWATLWKKGQSISADEFLAREESHHKKEDGRHDGLTHREVEVLQLVETGLSNREVAGRLFVSLRTVDAHLRSIYRKLGVTSRTGAVRTAAQQGLIKAPDAKP